MTANFQFIFSALFFSLTVIWMAALLHEYFRGTERPWIPLFLKVFGLLVLGAYIIGLWHSLERPPMRTLGETRLWYAFLLPLIGVYMGVYLKAIWISHYTIYMALLFLFINWLNPQNFDKALMPALQSPWFIPHVIVYMIAYAALGATALFSLKGLWFFYFKKNKDLTLLKNLIDQSHVLLYAGFAFLSLGLLFGALWAKEAWGHYWTWDPKETWAFLTWAAYLIYIHWRERYPQKVVAATWILSFAFIVLLGCWFGVNYLPSAQQSVHTYTN